MIHVAVHIFFRRYEYPYKLGIRTNPFLVPLEVYSISIAKYYYQNYVQRNPALD